MVNNSTTIERRRSKIRCDAFVLPITVTHRIGAARSAYFLLLWRGRRFARGGAGGGFRERAVSSRWSWPFRTRFGRRRFLGRLGLVVFGVGHWHEPYESLPLANFKTNSQTVTFHAT